MRTGEEEGAPQPYEPRPPGVLQDATFTAPEVNPYNGP